MSQPALVTIEKNKINLEIGEKSAELEIIDGKVYLSYFGPEHRKFHIQKSQEQVMEWAGYVGLHSFIKEHLYNIIMLSTGKDNFGFLDTYLNHPY